jgi:uncharacterized membrane protein
MKSRRISRVIFCIGVALLLVGAALFARELITSFHSESYTSRDGTGSIDQGFHTSMKTIGIGFTGLVLVVLSVWLPQRS